MCKISSLTLAATVWVFGIICGVAGADASPSVEDLTALLTKRDKELHSLAAVYREVFRGSRDGIVDGYLRRSVAFRSPCWFFRDNSHGHARLDWRQDPRRKTLLIRPGETTLLENLNRVLLDPAFTADGSAPFDVQRASLPRALLVALHGLAAA